VAEHEGKVIGMALYFFVYSTWKGRMIYLEDFVVEESYRRKGIGQRLWDTLKERGRERGCKLLKWQILETNTEALKFYAAQDATIEEDWLNGKLYL
jgi:GNAT superfamily N-acetyltransferase